MTVGIYDGFRRAYLDTQIGLLWSQYMGLSKSMMGIFRSVGVCQGFMRECLSWWIYVVLMMGIC